MLFYFLKAKRSKKRNHWNLTLDRLNARIREYVWPAGFRIPTFTAGYLEKGTKEGLCKKGCHVHMTAGDMMVFARHSIDLLLPLIYDPLDPIWLCWVAHMRYVRVLMQPQLTHGELLELDQLIYQAHTSFLASQELGKRMFKPKCHFASHFPSDIYNFGPVRGYWCMRFEALNQLFKSFAAHGSYRDTCRRCAEMWTIRIARERTSPPAQVWGATRIVAGSLLRSYVRESANLPFMVADMFSLAPSKKVFRIEWIQRLYHLGSEYVAGEAWFSALFMGEQILAHIPKQGMLRVGGRSIILAAHIYPYAVEEQFGLPSTQFASSFEPQIRLIKLSPASLTNLILLWPSYRKETRGQVHFRFVPL